MIIGYNHNVLHRNRVYHIQTEDSGIKYPHIITHLFIGGNIIASKKRSYAHLLEQNLSQEELENSVREMMKQQHKEMLLELKSGKYDNIAIPDEEGGDDIGSESPNDGAGEARSSDYSGVSIYGEGRSEPRELNTAERSVEQPEFRSPGTDIRENSPLRPKRRTSRRINTRERPRFASPTPPEVKIVDVLSALSDETDINTPPPEGDLDSSPTIPDLPQLLEMFEKGDFRSNSPAFPSEGRGTKTSERARFSALRKERFRGARSGRPTLELKPKSSDKK